MKNKFRFLITAAAAASVLLLYSCGASDQPGAESQTESQSQSPAPAQAEAQAGSALSAVVMDLSVPPPGSQATQEKWDSFDESKKKDSWAKYFSENPQETADASVSSGGSAPAAAAAASAPVPVPAPAAAPSAKTQIISVVAGELTKAPITLYYYGLGELKAGREQKVSPAAAGTAEALYVSEGDFVEKGDLLFSLDDSELVRDIELVNEKWNAELELAQIRLNEAFTNYESSASLYARDLITGTENDNAKKVWEEAKIAYEKVRLAKTTELGKLQENLRSNVAVSSGRGYVSEITFNEGEQVNTADFIEIVDIEHIVISIPVPENIITRIRTGNEVLAKQASGPSYSLEGVVTGRGVVSDSNRSFEVLAKLENPDQRLLPGMLMEAQIRIAQLTANFIIPKESLIQEGANNFIYLVKDDAAKKVPVTVGQSRGSLIQVNGAIEEGDLLVLQGQSYLREGTGVKIVETRKYLPERREL